MKNKKPIGLICAVGVVAAVVVASVIGTSIVKNKSKDSDKKLNKDNTNLTMVPTVEKVGTYNYFYDGYYVRTEDSSGYFLYGKEYLNDNHKFYVKGYNRWQNGGSILHTPIECYTSRCKYIDETYVSSPDDNDNILFLKYEEDHNIEIKDTGDAIFAFLALDEETLVVISTNRVRGFSVNSGNQLWEIKLGDNLNFGSTLRSIKTDGKKILLEAFQNQDDKKFAGIKVVNIEKQSITDLKLSGSFYSKEGYVIADYDKYKMIDGTLDDISIIGDKYFYNRFEGGAIIDSNGRIEIPFKTGYFTPLDNNMIVYFSNDDYGNKKYAIYNNDGKVIKQGNFYHNMKSFGKLKLDDTYVIYMFGDKKYYAVDDSGGTMYEIGVYFDDENNILTGLDLSEMRFYDNPMIFEYKVVPENLNKDMDSDYFPTALINLYTGKKLEGYSIVKTSGLGYGDKIVRENIAYVQDENKKRYFMDSDFNKLYTLDDNEEVIFYNNYKSSKYLAYTTEDGAVYALDKNNYSNKIKVKDAAKDDNDKAGALIVNGDFIMYTLYKSDCSELYAYDVKDGKTSLIFKTNSENEKIYFNTIDQHQNNWFYVEYSNDENEDKKYETYKFK